MKRFLIWLTGRDLFYRKPKSEPGVVTFTGNPPTLFEYTPVGDWFAITLRISAAPNVFHRAMQRILLGMKYRMLKK